MQPGVKGHGLWIGTGPSRRVFMAPLAMLLGAPLLAIPSWLEPRPHGWPLPVMLGLVVAILLLPVLWLLQLTRCGVLIDKSLSR